MKKYNFVAFFILLTNTLMAQYKTTAKITAVTQNGLHKIVLPSDIRSYSNEALSDFRIFDTKGTEVPYYIVTENDTNTAATFSEFKIVSRKAIPQKKTTLIVENSRTSLAEIALSISNSDVRKPYSISGSNDQKEWFGLINKAVLSQLENSEETSVVKRIPLPLSSYRYLKIEFDDSKTLAVNILKIGFFSSKSSLAKLVKIPAKSIHTTLLPTEKKTRIHVVFKQPQMVNQIRFTVSNPNLFQRNAQMYVLKKTTLKHKTRTYKEPISNFQLSSDYGNSFFITHFFEKECFIEIDNRDNPQLTITKMAFFQKPIAIIVNLKANETYSIKTGNEKLQNPEYDLENFKNKMNNPLAEAKIYDIQQFVTPKSTIQNKSFWQHSWFMWLCIGFGGIAIGYFSSILIKDMKKNS